MLKTVCSGLLLAALAVLAPSSARAAHGVSIDGKLKYPAGFAQFDYASPAAQKGGSLVLHDIGSFDKMNPYTLKGTPPMGLDSFVFEPLAVSSLDEPFAAYGLIAKDIALAEDKKSVTYTLDERAKFSDGSPVTAEDVKFSLDTLKGDKAAPFYQIYLQDISGAEVLGPLQVRFNFAKVNRELHMIASQLPVLQKKFYERNGFGEGAQGDPLLPPVGSGPYIVKEVNPGKSITYARNPNYWAAGHPARKGLFNFDTVTIKYFKDQVVAVEAFKAGDFDFMWVSVAKQWQRDLSGRQFDSGTLIRKEFPHHNNAGMQGFLFNTRKPFFKDRKVRQALGLAFDFEWANESLFFKQYTRNSSYFSNSDLAAAGLPGEAELKLLKPLQEKYPDAMPPEVFTQPLAAPSTAPPSSLRGNLKLAQQMLAEQGWQIKDGVLTGTDGTKFQFDILLTGSFFDRIMAPYVKNLEKLGIKASYRMIDPALYEDRLKNFDFDMIVHSFGESQSPGNEQRDRWASSSAARQGSGNLAGAQSPVVDSLVDSLIYAQTQEELTAACKSLDRVLWYGYYVVPNWYLAYHRVAFSSKFKMPDKLPTYYSPYDLLWTWWTEGGK